MHAGRGTRPDLEPVAVTALVAMVGFAVLAALALALGAAVVHGVVGHPLGRGDLEIARWFAARRTDLRDTLSLVGSYFAETVTVVVVTILLLAVLAHRRRWPLFALVAVSIAVEPLVYLVATYFVSRDRPAVPRLEHLIVSDSFPSGHTAAATVLYSCIAIVVWAETDRRLWRALAIVLAVLGPIVVAVSRVYRGMHNPTDVISGALIGAGCVVVGYVAAQAGVAAARRRDERSATAPGWSPASRESRDQPPLATEVAS